MSPFLIQLLKFIFGVLVFCLFVVIVVVLVFGSDSNASDSSNPTDNAVDEVEFKREMKRDPPVQPSSSPPVAKTNFCYRYANNPMRTLFYESKDCPLFGGWDFNDPNVGNGGIIKGYSSKQPKTEKFCYRYASDPFRTLFYKSNDCSPKWGWGFNDVHGAGHGGEVFFLYFTTTKH
jgi:hypothetical protein